MVYLANKIPPSTVTSKVTATVFPDGSVKMYVTGVVPTGKNELGAWDLETRVTVPESSAAVGSSQLTVVPVEPGGAVTTMTSSFG